MLNFIKSSLEHHSYIAIQFTQYERIQKWNIKIRNNIWEKEILKKINQLLISSLNIIIDDCSSSVEFNGD